LAAGGAAGELFEELLFCEEKPLLYDDDVPECEDGRASASALLPSARHKVSNRAE
jgi:hypothetical protein